MAKYRIIVWDIESITKLFEATRTTRTSAHRLAWSKARDTLAAFGKLDTQAGRKVYEAMRLWGDLLPIGDERTITISNTGRSITMIREA